MRKVFHARRLHTPTGPLEYPVLTIADGQVADLLEGAPNSSTEILTSAFLDIHVHGAVTHDFMTADAPQIDAIGRFLAGKGVAYYLPTTVTGEIDSTLHALHRLAAKIDASTPTDAATPVAINLEGPFLCPAKRGVHPLDRLQAPSIELFDRFQDAAQGHIRLMTLAPEMPGALDLVRHAVAAGVRISLGHSNATAAETEAAIAAGASSATHTFNAMRAMEQRAPGVLGTVLDDDRLFAELICDRVHVADELVRLWLKAKGPERAILVTDSMAASGMPDGHYRLGSLDVEVAHGRCLAGGVIAGSVLTLDRAVLNLHQITGAPIATSARLASANPANLLGLAAIPEIAIGRPAQICRFSPEGRLLSSWIHGALTHPAEL